MEGLSDQEKTQEDESLIRMIEIWHERIVSQSRRDWKLQNPPGNRLI